jgi:hypothetical protein
VKKRPFLEAHQLKRLKRELDEGKFSRFRILLCAATGCKSPIPKEDPVEGQPMTRFCSYKCYATTTGAGDEG